MAEESMTFDFVIVGAGPAGLSAAIRLAQLGNDSGNMPSICVLEKGESVGAHILSGAVLEPRALFSLLPDWRERRPPPHTPVTEDHFQFLTQKRKFRLPTPPQMRNKGNVIISLGQWCRWLAEQAESMGVSIFPGFPAAEILFDGDRVTGVRTQDQGRNREGQPTSRFQPGIAIYARQTLFAEGCRGYLSEQLMKRFNLRAECSPQTYALGIKELWEIPESQHTPGKVIHTVGWPLPHSVYGGSFVYHADHRKLAIGFVTGLDYDNPWTNPYEYFQLWKTHPSIAPLLQDGKRIAYGARSLNEGGYQSIPRTVFKGGLLLGCAAGFLNVPKIKGIHTAMLTGMIAAESVFAAGQGEACEAFSDRLKTSWLSLELYRARNIRPAFRWGLLPGLAYAAIDTLVLRGRAPWTFRHRPDYTALKPAKDCLDPVTPKHDNRITFDLTTSVWLARTQHDEHQPVHLKLKNPDIPFTVNLKKYAGPEQRYCPAGVYEFVESENTPPRLQINAANCVHCKACDIKDPTQNIVWTPPEGGSGPRYEAM